MPETIEIIGSTYLVTFSLSAKYTITEQISTNNVPVLGIEREEKKKQNKIESIVYLCLRVVCVSIEFYSHCQLKSSDCMQNGYAYNELRLFDFS